MKFLKIFLLAAVVFPGGEVSAEKLNMRKYISLVHSSSVDVLKCRQEEEIARLEYISKKADFYLPSLAYYLSNSPYSSANNPKWLFKKTGFSSKFSLSYNLFNSFSDDLSLKKARISCRVAQIDLWLAKQNATIKAIWRYTDFLRKKKLLEVYRASEKSYYEQYLKIEKYYNNGLKSYSDLLKSELSYKNAQLSTLRYIKDFTNSKMNFNSLIFTAPMEDVDLSDLKVSSGVLKTPVLEKGIEEGLRNRPEIERKRLDVEWKKLEIREKKINLLPAVTLDMTYLREYVFGLGENEPGKSNYSLDFVLSFPFGSTTLGKRKDYSSSVFDFESAKKEMEELEIEIKKEIISAWLDLSTEIKKYEVAKIKAKISRDNLDIVKKKYAEGRADIIELAEAQNDDLSAKSELADVYYNLYVKRREYYKAVGRKLW